MWEPDGHKKQDFTGLAIQASQFQLPDGTVLGTGSNDMPTNITINIEEIKIQKAVFNVCDQDEEAAEETLEEEAPE